jgi:hypothetical protein
MLLFKTFSKRVVEMNKIEKIYISEKEAAHRYCLSVHWFRRKRWFGNGPEYSKVQGGKILYNIEATDKWFESFKTKSTSISPQIAHQL